MITKSIKLSTYCASCSNTIAVKNKFLIFESLDLKAMKKVITPEFEPGVKCPRCESTRIDRSFQFVHVEKIKVNPIEITPKKDQQSLLKDSLIALQQSHLYSPKDKELLTSYYQTKLKQLQL